MNRPNKIRGFMPDIYRILAKYGLTRVFNGVFISLNLSKQCLMEETSETNCDTCTGETDVFKH